MGLGLDIVFLGYLRGFDWELGYYVCGCVRREEMRSWQTENGNYGKDGVGWKKWFMVGLGGVFDIL